MKNKIRLSILDQSMIPQGKNAKESIEETIATAQMADELGYYRFWLSEHHNSSSIGGSVPEVLLARIGNETKDMRIGSGGVMLPNHSALKIAESFRMLEVLYPNRIDLGIGRAPGGDRITASILNPSNNFSEESYRTQLDYLQVFFRDMAETQYGKMLAIPQADTIPEQWILSSTGGSASIASRYGMGLAIAKFINGNVSPSIVEVYKENFVYNLNLPKPEILVAVFAICSDSETRAKELRKLYDYMLAKFEKGQFEKLPSYEQIADYQFDEFELASIERNKGKVISGTPSQVKEQIMQIANDFQAGEIMVSTATHSFEERRKSFELIIKEFKN